MTINANQVFDQTTEPQVEQHPAWHGLIAGLEAEDRLRGQQTFTYLLRKGEIPNHYYVSFVLTDGTFKHQPFMVHTTPHGWYCKNASGTGPFLNLTIDDVVHIIIHCEKEDVTPLMMN
jgi:hypothetical protein